MSDVDPAPDPLPAAQNADVAGTVSEMKRLLTQLEAAESADPRSRDLMETLRVNTRMLQYIHDAHTRMAETLKRADRSDLVIQSADALNATFRQLRQSQEQLADRLRAERRMRPWAFVAGTLVVAAILVPAFLWLLDRAGERLDRQAQRMARAETTLVESSKSVERVEQGNTALRELFDEGLAANRVLIHETRAQLAEIEALKARMAAMEKEKVDAVTSALTSKDKVAALDGELQRAREKLVEMQDEHAALAAQLEARVQEAAKAQAPAVTVDSIVTPIPTEPKPPLPESAADPAAQPAVPVATTNANDAVPEGGSTEIPSASGAPVESATPAAPAQDPIVAAVNRVFDEAGIHTLALLAASGVVDGALDAPTFSVRSDEGFPIGFHQAERAHLRVDPVTRMGDLVLTHGSTLIRGEREDFSLGDKIVPIGLLADGAWTRMELAPIVVLGGGAPAEPASVVPVGVDVGAVLRDVNRLLQDDGYGASTLRAMRRVEWVDGHARLLEVELDQKSGAGLISKTVKAAWCDVLVDAQARTVALRFQDGVHVVKDREIPFFQGAGDSVGTWSMPLTRASIARWQEFAAQLEASLPR
ncbi:MAG: hypothetical protein IPH13_21500 [Planctomycetes bacterium]|nr:hypothetical protein [Planctomycetota bacterium]